LKPRNLEYKLEITYNAGRTLDKINDLDHKTAVIISNHIDRLSEDPYTLRSGVDIKKITNSDPTTYRLRIGAQMRIEYTVNDDNHTVTIERIIPAKRRNTDYNKR
jgi:mRNA-degrading endonuclease RelE of RelBE toxin-antitoxin system